MRKRVLLITTENWLFCNRFLLHHIHTSESILCRMFRGEHREHINEIEIGSISVISEEAMRRTDEIVDEWWVIQETKCMIKIVSYGNELGYGCSYIYAG